VSILRVLAKHQEGIVERQMLLDRIASSAIAFYTTTAVISRLDRDLARSNGNAESVKRDLLVGKLYCRQAFATIDRSLAGLFDNDDDYVERVADRLSGVA
jgi:hypothetical protein